MSDKKYKIYSWKAIIDILEILKAIVEERKARGEKVTISDLVNEALRDFIIKIKDEIKSVLNNRLKKKAETICSTDYQIK